MSDPPASSAAISAGLKRKRSIIACFNCHVRKVRCNVATQGTPCSNCLEDSTQCEIYQRKIGIPGQGAPRVKRTFDQSPTSNEDTPLAPKGRSYPLTPSSGPTTTERPPSSLASGGIIDHHLAAPSSVEHDESAAQTSSAHDIRPDEISEALRQKSAHQFVQKFSKDVEPHFAGESEGLEFLFDICAPDRPIKGVHYMTPRRTYRRNRTTFNVATDVNGNPSLPPPDLLHELVRCFFHWVYPVLPVVKLGEFLKAVDNDATEISPLLLWSVCFSALNFIDTEILKAHNVPPRKIVKEQYYQNAKRLYDAQVEPDKTVLMASCLLLGMWYVDLDDRDGSWYWIGTAISLAQTMGLHRASNFASMPACPIPRSLQLLWRRIWWCCFYREAWLAQGFGRPMRVSVDDCDEVLPRTDEVLDEIREVPQELINKYMPRNMEILLDCWILTVHLSIEMSDILAMHYRPRSPIPTPQVIRDQETRLFNLKARVPRSSLNTPVVTSTHICHLELYCNATLFLLWRALIGHPPQKLPNPEYNECRTDCVLKGKQLTTETTNILNRLMSLNTIDQSPSSFISTIMTSSQFLVHDVSTSTGLGKSHASHQLDLHLLVMSHLRKTYWTADLQHTLFTEVLKVINNPGDHSENNQATRIPANEPAAERQESGHDTEQHQAGPEVFEMEPNLAAQQASLDEFFGVFNPFMGVPAYADDMSNPVEWNLMPAGSMTLPGVSERLDG